MNMNSEKPFKALNVLLAEDNADHAELIMDSLKDFNIDNQITHVSNGEDLLDCLEKALGDNSRLPDLILLDLKMPRLDGKGALREIKNNPALRSIPVLVLTTSASQSEIEECYNYGACSYIIKPLNIEDLDRKLRDLNLYWVNTSELPE